MMITSGYAAVFTTRHATRQPDAERRGTGLLTMYSDRDQQGEYRQGVSPWPYQRKW